ncbi:VOC family protein [Actinoplanes sp. DH11]|uniref:VOC family protein n=1 Tax=Actinoplanes sp. DH11 TaxID=2857011 RepID=UPI001E496B44|nr:VOC family protein [Actinoplanes sp. DH11]
MATARYVGVSLDTDNPQQLADFYSKLLDAEITYTSDEFVYIQTPGIGFVKVDKHVPPTWPNPDVPKQSHFELGVDDLDAGEAAVVALGATKPEFQPQPDRWRVLLDPAGHPFCISASM